MVLADLKDIPLNLLKTQAWISFTKYFKMYSMLKAYLGLLVILGHYYVSLSF